MPRKRRSKRRNHFLSTPKKRKEFFRFLGVACLLFFLFVSFYRFSQYRKVDLDEIPEHPTLSKRQVRNLQKTIRNYGAEVDRYAAQLDLPNSYCKALINLESSGRKVFKPRFEKKVFRQLMLVRDGTISNYGSITQKEIGNASDEALKNLATSWGPFQLMGYLVINMDIRVQDIRGENAVYWGMRWIKKRYGNYLEENRFSDAFHIHNTGKPLPKSKISYTTDPNYVKKGLLYMQWFEGQE
jgi:hypothetical protein